MYKVIEKRLNIYKFRFNFSLKNIDFTYFKFIIKINHYF